MTFTFAFGDSADEPGAVLGTGIPLLAGAAREPVLGPVEPAGRSGSFSLWRGAAGLAGFARVDPAGDLEGAARRTYAELLGAARGLGLYRIWNLVPGINRARPDGLENYRAFCKGRSVAFEEGLGRGFVARLPAASGVGTAAKELTIAFLAGPGPARYFENPEQVPAYAYPEEHGPRPPSFSRATVVENEGRVDAYFSGTSAIAGHATVSPHETSGQLERTIRNLVLVSRACGLGEDLGAAKAASRHFKVYLRSPADLPAVTRRMQAALVRPGDLVSYLGADICRPELNVEVEATVLGAARI
jgi:hypothetical protein